MKDEYNSKLSSIKEDNLNSLGEIQNIISRAGVLKVFHILLIMDQGVRYTDLQNKTNISFGALYPNLVKLDKLRYINKIKRYNITFYKLTSKGLKLALRLNKLM